MGRRTLIAAVIVAAAVAASSATATELTIYPGIGIGKIKLGMTLAHAQKVLGKNKLVSARGTVGGRHYIEYGWEFGTWSLGFLQSGRTLRVVQVETTLRAQRTRRGAGVGSSFLSIVHTYKNATCASLKAFGSKIPYNGGVGLIVGSKGGTQTLFLVQPVDKSKSFGVHPWRVYAVIVRQALLPTNAACDPGWKDRGTPFRPIG